MKNVGIVTEYNPFHNGHAAQLAQVRAKGAQKIVVCMGVGATQRGELPLLPFPVRVAAALQAGADLVIALPAPYANASAEQFAAAGVRLLAALGCDTLAFGAETPDADTMLQAAELLRGDALRQALRVQLDAGLPLAAAREAAAEMLRPGFGALLRSPNNILGIEYCKAILEQGTGMTPLALPRLGAGHGDTVPGKVGETAIASASYLRRALQGEHADLAALRPYVPKAADLLYRHAAEHGQLLDREKFSTAVLARLRGCKAEELHALRGVGEGLEHRLVAALRQAATVEELYTAMQTRRYPNARLRRLVLDAALGTPAELPLPPYLLVLGARREALPLLKHAALPAGTSLATLARANDDCAKIAEMHNRAVDFSSLCREHSMPMGLALTAKPVVL